MIDQLSELPAAAPDACEAERVRRRCHAALQQPGPASASPLERVLLAASLVYLLSAVVHLLAVFRP